MITNRIYQVINHDFNYKYYILLIFSIGCLVRGIPELIAYPYPIGYDVINYYIPAVTFFDSQWRTILHQFPVYVFLLHLINIFSGLNPYHTVIAVATGVFGIFAVSLFFVGQKILKLTAMESTFLSLFVIFQLAVLKASLDLHRDMLALSILLLTYVLIYKRNQSNVSFQTIAIAMVFSAIIVSTDGMIGALFMLSLIIYSFIAKTKIVILCTIVAVAFFTVTILPTENNFHRILYLQMTHQTESGRTYNEYYMEPQQVFYEPISLVISFFLLNALLIPTGVFGLSKAMTKEDKPLLLTLPLLICFLLSLSWILFPKNTTLVPYRWMMLVGIFLSIFAAYGIVRLIMRAKRTSAYKRIIISSSILGMFIIIGMVYATRPADQSFNLFDATNPYTRSLTLGTMQPDKESNDKLINAISWINNNTAENSTIMGAKNMRGYMQLKLDTERKWKDFGLSENNAERYFELFDNFLVDHEKERDNFTADPENTYVVTSRTDFLNYTSNNLKYMKVYSGGLNIFKLQFIDKMREWK